VQRALETFDADVRRRVPGGDGDDVGLARADQVAAEGLADVGARELCPVPVVVRYLVVEAVQAEGAFCSHEP
jgi:hypothetical protein